MSKRRVILITGGSRGIGAATARLAYRRGYDICLSYRAAADEAAAIVAEAKASGSEAAAVMADVSDSADISRLFEAVDARFGRLDGLVNNAGITGPLSRVADIDEASLARVFQINVVGAFLVAREAVRRMSTKRGGTGGTIVNIASRASDLGGAGELVHYAASKGAIDTLTIGLAREVAGEGIRVNAVSPGIVATEIHAAMGDAGRIQRLGGTSPLGRAGTAEEVAAAILWLLSEEASYVTGAILPVSGGR